MYLYRYGANVLGTNDELTIQRGATSDAVFSAKLTTDGAYRLVIFNDGKMEWGDGTAARDTNLYRPVADVLKTDDTFDALALRIGGTEVLTSVRKLQNIASVLQTLLPDADSTYDLGSSTYYWQAAYLDRIKLQELAADPTVAEGLIWFRGDTDILHGYFNAATRNIWPAAWGDITGKPSTFPPSAHASSHRTGGTDVIGYIPWRLYSKQAVTSTGVTFSSLPAKDLWMLVLCYKTGNTGSLRFNGDSGTNYEYVYHNQNTWYMATSQTRITMPYGDKIVGTVIIQGKVGASPYDHAVVLNVFGELVTATPFKGNWSYNADISTISISWASDTGAAGYVALYYLDW